KKSILSRKKGWNDGSFVHVLMSPWSPAAPDVVSAATSLSVGANPTRRFFTFLAAVTAVSGSKGPDTVPLLLLELELDVPPLELDVVPLDEVVPLDVVPLDDVEAPEELEAPDELVLPELALDVAPAPLLVDEVVPPELDVVTPAELALVL